MRIWIVLVGLVGCLAAQAEPAHDGSGCKGDHAGLEELHAGDGGDDPQQAAVGNGAVVGRGEGHRGRLNAQAALLRMGLLQSSGRGVMLQID